MATKQQATRKTMDASTARLIGDMSWAGFMTGYSYARGDGQHDPAQDEVNDEAEKYAARTVKMMRRSSAPKSKPSPSGKPRS